MPTIAINWPDVGDVVYDVPLRAMSQLTATVFRLGSRISCFLRFGEYDAATPRGDLGKDLALYALGIDLTTPPGLLVVLCGPSGSGKTTVQELVTEKLDGIRAISYTTRRQRPGEINGVDYHFVERAAFEQMIDAGAFVEHAEFGGNLYGSVAPKVPYNKVAIQVAEMEGCDSYRRLGVPSIFVALKASPEELEKRIRSRDISEAQKLERIADGPRFAEYITNSAWDCFIDTSAHTLEDTVQQVVDVIRDYIPM